MATAATAERETLTGSDGDGDGRESLILTSFPWTENAVSDGEGKLIDLLKGSACGLGIDCGGNRCDVAFPVHGHDAYLVHSYQPRGDMAERRLCVFYAH